MPMPICNHFHERLANNAKITTFMLVTLFDAFVRRFFETRKSRLGFSKSVFSAENFICSFSMSISIDFGAVHFWYVFCSPRSPKRSIKPLLWRSRSSKVIEFGGNHEPVYGFLLVINSNLGPISHHYWDTATYWLKITNFLPPLI